jgi:hypothetical protein
VRRVTLSLRARDATPAGGMVATSFAVTWRLTRTASGWQALVLTAAPR